LPNRLLNAFCVFAFLPTKNPFRKLVRAKTQIAVNVLGLAEVGELEAQMFNLAQMFVRIPNIKFSTSAPILASPC